MEKRKIIFGGYDTATHGWTLAGWQLGAAEPKTSYIEKVCGDGSWDLSTALTDGIPRYRDRPLTVTLELSEGDRQSREREIRAMINTLHGKRVNIHLPDDTAYHLSGRLNITKDYNDLAHAAVTVSAVCDPWKYANVVRAYAPTAASSTLRTVNISNNGYRAVVPVIEVTGTDASVQITYGTATRAFSVGTYQWPDLVLLPGSNTLKYQGSGSIKFTFEEAVLE